MLCNAKKHASLLFCGACLIIFIISMSINRGYFEPITHESVVWYECRQVLAILLLYAIGYVFLFLTASSLDRLLRVLFAFPIGQCLWVFVSYITLLIGIPYTMWGTLLLVVLAICFTHLIMWKWQGHHCSPQGNQNAPTVSKDQICNAKSSSKSWRMHLIVIGIAMLCSTGFLYIMISYDSLFYFINYGRALTVFQSFRAIEGANSFTLTNITQFLPLVCSYTAFWGLDQAFQIHAFLACNVVAAFGIGTYSAICGQSADNQETAHPKSVLLSIMLSAILATSTCYIVLSGWFLANMPCMVYIFFLYLTAVLYRKGSLSIGISSMMIGFCLAALALLRKDGIIYDAFFIVWMCSIELFNRKRLAALFTPAALLTLSWLAYVRLTMTVSVARGYYSSIANNKNIILVIGIIVGCYLYIRFGHDILSAICKRLPRLHETDFMYLAFVAGLLFVLAIHPDMTIDDWDYAIRNLFQFPSSWGISAILLGILLVLSFAIHSDLRGDHFVWIGYAMLNLISYCFVDSKVFWVNWDDSFNRVLMQIVPVMLFVIGTSFQHSPKQ